MKGNNRRIMGPDEEEKKWPAWLKPLLEENFFGQCKTHVYSHDKSENSNMFCLDCINGALCSLCLPHHKDHRLVQIRKSSYHEVVRVSDIQKYLDISFVQTYTINSQKVVFLNKRPQPKHGRGLTVNCEVCERSLVDSWARLCSLGCKVVATSQNSQTMNRKRLVASDSEDSYYSSSYKLNRKSPSFTPSTPPVTAVAYRSRRKGIPHRAPTGVRDIDI